MPVVLDPDAAAVYKAFLEAKRPRYEDGTPAQAREFYMAARLVANPDPPELADVAELAIASTHGTIPARLYTPKILRKSNDGLAPGLVFFHGGGWVIGNLDTHDVPGRNPADEGQLMVASVDYRPAPKHNFPAALDDSIAATAWIAKNARQLGIDPARIS